VAIVGAGTIGNFIAQSAKALGAASVLIADVNASRLARAKRCGIDFTVDTTSVELKDAIHDAFGTDMADVIIDAAGVPASLDSIIKAARCSSTIVMTGNFKEPYPMEVPLIQRQEISFIGHMMYVREDFEDAIRFMENGSVKVDELITQRFPASRIDEAFKFIDQNPNDVMKVVVYL
jgi:L-iditol 2-dehydrogenase